MTSRADEDQGHPPPNPQERQDASNEHMIRPAHAKGWGHVAGGGLGNSDGLEPQGAVYGSGQWGGASTPDSPCACDLLPPRQDRAERRSEASGQDDPLIPPLPQTQSPGASS